MNQNLFGVIPFRWPRNLRAFTLIELLVVVAIIAILAGIAVPNFLEALTRAKVGRAMSDLRSLGVAVEAYAVDHNVYPPNSSLALDSDSLIPLSTPIAYIADSHIPDPFDPITEFPKKKVYQYVHVHDSEPLITIVLADYFTPDERQQFVEQRYTLKSVGPDRIETYVYFLDLYGDPQSALDATVENLIMGDDIYDPTNGTVSFGDIDYDGKGFRRSGI